VDPDLALSLQRLQRISQVKCGEKVCPMETLSDWILMFYPQPPSKIGLLVETVDVEDLALDFTIPGYDIELKVCDF
jgi:hypothetical protein